MSRLRMEDDGLKTQKGVDGSFEEVRKINLWAFAMAELVLRDSSLRSHLCLPAAQRKKRLIGIAEEIKAGNPTLHRSLSQSISESILDLTFIETDSDSISLRLGPIAELEKVLLVPSCQNSGEASFPLPPDIQNFARAARSDAICFQTGWALEEVIAFYHQAFSKLGLRIYSPLGRGTEDLFLITFRGLPDGNVYAVQGIDLRQSSGKDVRHISLRTEKRDLS